MLGLLFMFLCRVLAGAFSQVRFGQDVGISNNWFRQFLLYVAVDLLLIVTLYVGYCNCSMFVVRYFMSILVLQSFPWGRESWLCCFVCLAGVLCLLCGSSSRCHRFICSLRLWYFLILSLTIF